jgi:hypothetical protein
MTIIFHGLVLEIRATPFPLPQLLGTRQTRLKIICANLCSSVSGFSRTPTSAGFLETSKIGLFHAIWIAKLLKTLE